MIRRTHLLLLGVTALVAVLLLLGGREPGRAPIPFHSAFGRGPTVALVHGLGSRPEHWFPVARSLARHHRVVLVELPGHRESTMPTPFSLERATDGLDGALRAETKDPVVLVGHSIGGLVAAAEALANPSRVRALVLVETALKPQVTDEERAALMSGLDQDYQGVLRSAYTAFGRDSAQGAELYREVAELDSTAIKRWIRLALSADLSQQVAYLNVPVLVVLAERSWPVTESWQLAAGELGYTSVPDLRVHRIEGCGHFVMLDRPEELAGVIETFLEHPDGEPAALESAPQYAQ